MVTVSTFSTDFTSIKMDRKSLLRYADDYVFSILCDYINFQYLGCMVHFCPDVKCRINRKQFSACPNPLKPSLTNEEVLNETYYKLHVVLPRCGYKVKYIWEHTVKRQLMMSKEMRTFFDDPDRFSVLQTGGIENPREALYGECYFLPFY